MRLAFNVNYTLQYVNICLFISIPLWFVIVLMVIVAEIEMFTMHYAYVCFCVITIFLFASLS